MEERTRLGRGLEDVSRFYLSDHPRDASVRTRKTDPQPGRRHIVRVFCPDSGLIKSCFLANFALELARNRFHVDVWDGDRAEGARVAAMLPQVIHQGPVPGAGKVKLYGLPDIFIFDAEGQPEGKLEELAKVSCMERDRFFLVSTADTLESVVGWDTPFDAIILTPVDGASLLRCYAYCKVIRKRDPSSKIHIAFDDPASEAGAQEAFARFSGFVKERLPGDLNLLGCLVHDELLRDSITDRRPLVLTYDPSAAKDSLVAMSASFIQSGQADTQEEGVV